MTSSRLNQDNINAINKKLIIHMLRKTGFVHSEYLIHGCKIHKPSQLALFIFLFTPKLYKFGFHNTLGIDPILYIPGFPYGTNQSLF